MRDRKFKINLNLKLCKGCLICAKFCPVGVFEGTTDAKIAVVNEEKCVGCKACEDRCPDYALNVEER